jgi:hypothetical protein
MLFEPQCVAFAPVRGRQIRPTHVARSEVLAIVTHDSEKRLIGLKNPTIEIPDEDADYVGVDQAYRRSGTSRRTLQADRGSPDLGFAFREIAIEMGVLQRNRGLRGEELQYCGPGRCEGAAGQVVLEV